MREDAFRAFAATRLKPRGVSSYLSNCRHVEQATGFDLDTTALVEPGIRDMLRHVADGGTPPARVSDCGSALRMYARFKVEGSADVIAGPSVTRISAQTVSRGEPSSLPGSDLSRTRARDLLLLHASVIDELRHRGIVRTGNGPIGDYAEALFARALEWKLEANSMAGHDATDQAGMRYQIKARRVTTTSPSRQLGAIRRLPDLPFDMLAAVLFDARFEILHAVLIPVALVLEVAKPVAHTNSWRVMLNDGLIGAKGVRDVADALKVAHRVI